MEFKHFVHTFKGENFAQWKTRLMAYMEYKEVDDVITRRLPQTAEDYTSKNRLARAIILAALDDLHVRMVATSINAADMMKVLRDRYGNKSFVGHGHLIDEVTHMKMKPNETPHAYCDRFKMTVDDAFNAGIKFEDEHVIHFFLTGLDSRFATFVQLQNHMLQRAVIDATTLPSLFTELIQTYTGFKTHSNV